MHIYDLFKPQDLQDGMADGLIRVQENDFGQRIYSYTDKAMFTPGAWDNPAVRQCRGLIVSPLGTVVARPWAKFFNYGQPEAPSIDMDAKVEVTDKLDGSLGILYVDGQGGLRIATRGSFTSDQALHATHVLNTRYADVRWYPGVTYLFESIYHRIGLSVITE